MSGRAKPSPNSLQKFLLEINGQPEALQQFSRVKLGRAPKASIFVGAGDSYAASLAAFYHSGGECLALDPYSLIANPRMASGKDVYFVSVSGRTSSNVEAASCVRGLAHKTIAITAEEQSPLAKVAGETIKLPTRGVLSAPGLLSFSLSLLAALKVAGVDESCDFKEVLRKARQDSRRVSFGKDVTYFLGNSSAYSICVYAAGKMYEFLGAKAHAELLEEFSHTELFSLGKADAVNIFTCSDPSGQGKTLSGVLGDNGYDSKVVPCRGSSEWERLFHTVFVAQLGILKRAMSLGLSKPKFFSEADRLKISNRMIY